MQSWGGKQEALQRWAKHGVSRWDGGEVNRKSDREGQKREEVGGMVGR